MSKSNIPAVGPAVSGSSGTNLIASENICSMIRTMCPMVEDIICVQSADGSKTHLVAVNSCADQKIICEINDVSGLDEKQVREIVEEKTKQFLIEETICSLVDKKVNAFITEDQACQLISQKSFSVDSLCSEIAERCPHVKEVKIVGKTISVSFTNNAKEVQSYEIPCSTSRKNEDGTTTTVHPDRSEHTSVDNPVVSVSGPSVDNSDPSNPVISSSTTTPEQSGLVHVVTTDDGVSTKVCTNPLKSVVESETGGFAGVSQDGTRYEIPYKGGIKETENGTAVITLPNGDKKEFVCGPVAEVDELIIECPANSNSGTIQINEDDPVTFVKSIPTCSGSVDLKTDNVFVSSDGGLNLTGSPLEDGCYDISCAPALPEKDCLVEGSVTFSDGITWQVQNGEYKAVAFTPKSSTLVMSDEPDGPSSISDEQIAELTDAWTDVQCVSKTYVNNTCTRVIIKAVVRGMFQMTGTGNNIWAMRILGLNGGGFRLSNGAPDSRFDAKNGEPTGQQKDYGEYNAYAKVDPGESVTLKVCAQARVINENYTSHPNNKISIVGLTGRFEVERCC